jgi:formylglycine-generating enzyme required for sulfatase activity
VRATYFAKSMRAHAGLRLQATRAFQAALLALLTACGHKAPSSDASTSPSSGPVAIAPQGKVLEAAENEGPSGSARAQAAAPPAAAGTRVDVPSGKLVAGSTPGDRGRDPTLEPALLDIELGGFAIDRAPYPNDPKKPALTGVTRTRAAELCSQGGGRLCTELEWERACKGPDDTAFPGASAWSDECAKAPEKCASGFGAVGMGAVVREWTASDVAPVENVQAKGAAVRGARGDAASWDHRCAHRSAVDATSSGEDLGFRCCYGAPNAATLPAAQFHETFRKAELTPAQAAEMFASVPQLKDLGKEITYFKDPDDIHQVLAKGDAGVGTVPNTTFTTQPILWSPVPGEEILVVAGRAQKSAFIVAFYRLPGDRYRIGSSFILKDEKAAIALGTNSYNRRRIPWGLCWDCRGESGFVSYREDNRVVITQK